MKKVIITESQLKTLLNEERLALMLEEAIKEGADDYSLVRKLKHCIAAGASALAIFAAISHSALPNETKEFLKRCLSRMQPKSQEKDGGPQLDTTGFYKKVNDTKNYMEKALANQGYSLKSTKLKPETLVLASIETGFDLPFLMAVAHQESCFGATPRAKRTNSVFSVGSYDNGKNVKTYTDPNDSVTDYIDLLNRRYLVDGKTIFDLLKPGMFVNDVGNRYASDKNYESKINKLRNLIIKKFPDLVQ